MISERGESSAERTGKHDSIRRQFNFVNEEIDNRKEPDRLCINSRKINESSRSSDSMNSWRTKSTEISVDSSNALIKELSVSKSCSISTKPNDPILTENYARKWKQ